MASVNMPLAASGFVGAITSLIVGSTERILPSTDAKSLLAIGSGMLAAIIVFEIMSWFSIIRLNLTLRSLRRIMPQFETIQSQLNNSAIKQIEVMRSHNATAKSIQGIEGEITDLSVSMARAILKIQQKSIAILQQLDS